MKKLFTLTVIVGLALVAYGQAPQKMSYQCVVRNSAGALVASHAVGLKISILKGSATGTVVFSETYSPVPQTNANGLLTVEIGGGTASVGTFAGIDWSAGPYFLKTETDPAGGTDYTITGTSQLLSVPYALYAKTAANGFSGAWADISGKPSFATVATSGSFNDLLNRPSLFSGSYIDLTNKPVLFDGTWTSLTGKPVLFDGTWTSLTGKPVLFDGTWTSLSGKPAGFADGIDNVDDADNSITNEIQALSLSGTVLSLSSGGGSVTLPSSGGGDNWGTQVVVTDVSLAGNGTTATPLMIPDNGVTAAKIASGAVNTAKILDATVSNADLSDNSVTSAKIASAAVTGNKIAQAGATAGQALKWNGTTWAPADDATGGSGVGWTDGGTTVRLSTTTDTVQLGSVSPLGKLNVGGNIGLPLLSNIYFGSDATRITGLTGGDLRLVAEDLSMLTTENITFGHYGDETWIEFDNANKRVGIGTLAPTDRLHVVRSATA